MENIYIKAGVFYGIVYIIFAVLPDVFSIALLPTGGWDWLGFLGVISGIVMAYKGIIKTIQTQADITKMQSRLNMIPMLDVRSQPNYRVSDVNYFIVLKEQSNFLINNGFIRNDTGEFPHGFNHSSSFILKNIGLSSAQNLRIYLHCIDKINGLNSLNDLFIRGNMAVKENLYINANMKPCQRKEDGYLLDSEWMITDPFNIPNSLEYSVTLAFDIQIYSSYHFMIEYRYNDLYGNKYHQLQYLWMDEKTAKSQSISSVFVGESYKT